MVDIVKFGKRGKNNIFISCMIITLFLAVIVLAENPALNNNVLNELNITKPSFAQNINNHSIDTPYIKEYFKWYDNFSEVNFADLDKEKRRFSSRKEKKIIIRDKHEINDKKGFLINNTKFVLHLIACNKEHKTCNFRMNGVLIKDITVADNNEITLTVDYVIKINSIDFDYCDGRRFCDYHYEAYDKVDMSINLETSK